MKSMLLVIVRNIHIYMYTDGYSHGSLLLVQKETRVSKKANDGGDEDNPPSGKKNIC